MNLLIIGGTAYFGTDIVELALEAGHRVTICSRGNARPRRFPACARSTGSRQALLFITSRSLETLG